MPEEDNKISKYNQGGKSIKVPIIIYADLESLLEKMNILHNNPEKSSTTKINKHTSSGYSLFTHSLFSFDTTKIINYKEMMPLTKEEKCIEDKKKCYLCKKKI